MPLWLAEEPLVLASRSKVRQTLLEAAGIPIEAVRPISMSAAWKPLRPRRRRARSPRFWRGKKPPRWRALSPADSPRRRSDVVRSAPSALPSRPIGRRRARSCARCPAARMSFIRRSPSCRTDTVLFEHVGVRAADHALVVGSVSRSLISMPPARGDRERRRLSVRRSRHSVVRTRRRRLFHGAGFAAAAGAGFSAPARCLAQ